MQTKPSRPNNRRLRVLHLLGSAQHDGTSVAHIVCTLAQALHPEIETDVAFLDAPGPLSRQLGELGVSVHCLRWNDGLRNVAGTLRFAQLLRRGGYNILHQHTVGRAPFMVAGFLPSSPGRLLHLHGRITESHGPTVQRAACNGADAVVATSRAVADIARHPRTTVLYAGVDVGPLRAPRADAGALTIGFAGRLEPIKGIEYLIDAMAALSDVRLEIAGEGSQEQSLRDRVRSRHLEGRVAFLGWQTALADSLNRWDVFVLPSLEEAFGIAALQAMASSLPVIATRVGGLPELVRHEVEGVLVPAGDAGALASAIQVLKDSPKLRQQFSQAGRARASEFSVARMVAAMRAVYEEVAEPKAVSL